MLRRVGASQLHPSTGSEAISHRTDSSPQSPQRRNLRGKVQLITPQRIMATALPQRIGELDDRLVDVTGNILEPFGAAHRRALRIRYRRLAFPRIILERRCKIIVGVQAISQPDRILHRERGARPDREVSGVR